MRPILLFLTISACGANVPVHYVAPPPPAAALPVASVPRGAALDVDVDAEAKVTAKGFPAMSSDGHVAVSIEELGDGMRGFPNVVMYVFDGTKGGAPERTMQIIDVSDTAERPEDAGENFLRDRVRPRLAAVRAVLRDKEWLPLDDARLAITFEEQKLRVTDEATNRVIRSHEYPGDVEGQCVFEPYTAKAYSDAHRHWLLVKIGYRSGPDWCNKDDALELVVLH